MSDDAHGCATACYSGGPGEPYYQPYFECTCGWNIREPSWEEAGAAFDSHLAEHPEVKDDHVG